MTLSKTIAVLAAGAVLIVTPWLTQSVLAQQVGTATAVNPAAESTPPGGSTGPLTVGAHVVHKERIHTSSSGSAQLMFLDKSSLSIAPNTTITIDQSRCALASASRTAKSKRSSITPKKPRRGRGSEA